MFTTVRFSIFQGSHSGFDIDLDLPSEGPEVEVVSTKGVRPGQQQASQALRVGNRDPLRTRPLQGGRTGSQHNLDPPRTKQACDNCISVARIKVER